MTGGVAGDDRGVLAVSMIRDLPGDRPDAAGRSTLSSTPRDTGATDANTSDQPAPDTSSETAAQKDSAAGARQALADAHALTDGPEKPALDQPNPWSQASFLAQHDQYASSLWRDVAPCWKAATHSGGISVRVVLDQDGNLMRADLLRDHSVSGPALDEEALDSAIDALQACGPYKRYSGASRTYDVRFPG